MSLISVPENFLKSAGVKNPKLIIYGVGTILIIAAGYMVYKTVRNFGVNLGLGNMNTPDKTGDEMQNELNRLKTGGASLSDGQATIIAQNLLNAMDRWGTDDQSIIDNLNRAQSQADLNMIIQKFGIKPYDGVGLTDTFLSNLVWKLMKNLQGWLRAELSGSSLSKVKDIFDRNNVPF